MSGTILKNTEQEFDNSHAKRHFSRYKRKNKLSEKEIDFTINIQYGKVCT